MLRHRREANPGGVGEYTLEGSQYMHYWGDKPDEITTAMVVVMIALASVFFLVADQVISLIVRSVLGLGL